MSEKDNPNNFKFTEYGAKRDISNRARVNMYKRLHDITKKLSFFTFKNKKAEQSNSVQNNEENKKTTESQKMEIKEKIKAVKKLYSEIYKVDNQMHKIFNEKFYDDNVGKLIPNVEDLVFLYLFDKTFDEIHEYFSTPGNPEPGKPVLWEEGFPPEQLVDLLKNKDSNIDTIVEKANLIKEGLKE